MSHIALRRHRLASALALVLLPTFALHAQDAGTNQAQSQDQAAQGEKKAKTLDKVVVTGSRIARAEVEGPAPVNIIKGEDIQKQGFNTVFEVMNSITQAGIAETPPSWGSTSVNARQLNLRNMGSNRSLLLIDGHRVTDYPMPANGKTNFQNYNNIPTGMIDRIEVLATGASA